MSYPKSSDKKIQKLSNLLTKYAEREGVEFCIGDQVLYPVEAFAHFGCLPLFLLEAQEQYEKIYNNRFTVEDLMSSFNTKIKELTIEQMLEEQEYLENKPMEYKFPIEYREQDSDGTYFGFVPTVPMEATNEFFMIAHFTQYTVEEYIKIYKNKKLLLIDGRVPLDLLYEKFEKKVNTRQIKIISSVQTALDNGINPEDSLDNNLNNTLQSNNT